MSKVTGKTSESRRRTKNVQETVDMRFDFSFSNKPWTYTVTEESPPKTTLKSDEPERDESPNEQ